MAELDPSIILASRPVAYEPQGDAEFRALRAQQGQQQIAAGAQGLQLGAEQLRAEHFKNQQTAMDLADNARLRAVLAASMGTPASAPAAGPSGTAPDSYAGARLPSGLVDRTGASGPVLAGNPAPATAATAPPAAKDFDWDSVVNQLRGQVQPKTLFGLQQMVLGNKEKMATLEKTRQDAAEAATKVRTAEDDYFAGQAAQIQKLSYDPAAITVALHQAALVNPAYAQHAAQIQAAIAANPDAAKAIIDAVAASASAPMATAQARLTTAGTGAEKQSIEAPGQKATAEQLARSNAAAKLLTAQTGDDYQEVLDSLPHGLARLFPAWNAADPAGTLAAVRQAALTPEQQTTAAMTATRDANTARNEAAMRQQGAARLGIESAGLSIRRAEADPYGQLGINPHPIAGGLATNADGTPVSGADFLRTLPAGMAASVKAIAEGRQTNLPRGKELGPLMSAVNQYDPTYNAARGKARAAFTVGKQGQNVQSLNTAVVHLDQLADAADALRNGSFRPGNAAYNALAAAFGTASVTNFDALKTAVAGEMATALKGTATDQEIRHITDTLMSSNSPAQLAGIAKTNLHVLGAKLSTYDEQYHQTLGKDDPWSPVLPAARAVFQKNGLRPLASDTAAPAKKNPYR